MLKIKKYLFLYVIFTLLFSFICMLYYFNIMNGIFFKIFKFILVILLFIIQGMFSYKDLSKYRFIYCFIPNISLILLFLIISLVSKMFKVKLLFYLFILLFASLFGIFIHKKKKV